MGAMQSSVSPEVAVVGALVAGSVTAYGLYARNANAGDASASASALAGEKTKPAGTAAASAKKTKTKKKGAAGDAEFDKIIAAANKENQSAAAASAAQHARVVPFPAVVPGAFDASAESDTKEKKARKKKTKKAASASAASSTAALDKQPAHTSEEAPARDVAAPAPAELSRPATKKEKKRKAGKSEGATQAGSSNAGTPAGSALQTSKSHAAEGSSSSAAQGLAMSLTLSDAPEDASWTRVSTRKRAEANTATEAELLTSDTNLTTSVTDPENTEEDEGSAQESENLKTFAERKLPRPRKTGVEDMEDEPLQPTLARVIRVKPAPGEKPAKGFSWGDYEDYAQGDDGTSADGDADDVWEEVKSKRRTKPDPSSSVLASSADSLPLTHRASATPETKRQRQNAERRDAAKADKQAQERERLERLAQHKREVERARIAEQYAGGKKVGGGMTASVGDNGKLVWD